MNKMRASTFSEPLTVPYRIAVPADIPAMFRIRTRVVDNAMTIEELAALDITPDSVTEMLAGSVCGWVTQQGEVVTAFALANRADGCVFALFVDPDHEGQGYGTVLMQAVESCLFSQGLDQIWLETDADPQVRANGFYRHLGWLPAGLQEDGQRMFIKRAPLAG